MSSETITTIILAAGYSSRMNKFKPLANYNGKSFLENIIIKTNEISNQIIVVTGFNRHLIDEEIERINENLSIQIKTTFNQNFNQGMFSSIKAGLGEVVSDFALIHFVDQPSLPVEFYHEIKSVLSKDYDWIQPEYKRRKGHPILLNKRIYNLILSSSNDVSLKNLSEKLLNKLIYTTKFKEVTDNFNDEGFKNR